MRFSKHLAHKAISFEILFGLPCEWGPLSQGEGTRQAVANWISANNMENYQTNMRKEAAQKSLSPQKRKRIIKVGDSVYVPNTDENYGN